MPGELNLGGRKVRIRRFSAGDINDAYIQWLNDPEVTRFSNQRFHSHDRASCERYLKSFEGTPNEFLSVRRLDDDRTIGTMTAYFQPPHGTVDVGIMIGDRSVWGSGYGKDAWSTVLDWLLGREDVRKVTAGTLRINKGMIRLAEESGMIFEGLRKAQELVDGDAVDILLYGKFK